MDDAATIIDELGGATRVSEGIGKPVGTVSAWKTRQSIPVDQWMALVRFSKEIGVRGINFDRLVRIHTPEGVS